MIDKNEKYVTVICFNQFHGKKIFKIGSILRLIRSRTIIMMLRLSARI